MLISARTKVKNYQEILKDFHIIKSVKVCGNSVKVQGEKNSVEITESYKYSNKSIAKFVSQKVNYFVNINLKD